MRLFLMLVLLMGPGLAAAGELSLFDVPLQTSSRLVIQQAITKAGGKLQKSTGSLDVYKADKIGLPGAVSLEVLYLNGHFVLAKYSIEAQSPGEERLRKMLVTKYGYPDRPRDHFGGGGPQNDFDHEYIRDGKYAWPFDNDMQLVFTKEFFGNIYLSYIDRNRQEELEQRLKAQDDKSARKEATAKSSVF